LADVWVITSLTNGEFMWSNPRVQQEEEGKKEEGKEGLSDHEKERGKQEKTEQPEKDAKEETGGEDEP
jgi:hypothetical protein